MTSTDTLQAWLAIEHEAVWLYPVIGARFDGLVDDATRSYESHLAVRDQILARLHTLRVVPGRTQLSYDVGDLTDESPARAAARRVEQKVAAACLTLVGETIGDTRAYAMTGLKRSALAELTWGAEPRAFPGMA